MKYFFDTEFIEKPCTIELISIGIISEDGRKLYLESSEVSLSDVGPWLQENVLPHLTGKTLTCDEIAKHVLDFVGEDLKPEFWAYYADYDWVVFCWLFGPMVDLPKHFPMFCRDFKQTMETYGITRHELPRKPKNCHNALADAEWLKTAYEFVIEKVRDNNDSKVVLTQNHK